MSILKKRANNKIIKDNLEGKIKTDMESKSITTINKKNIELL